MVRFIVAVDEKRGLADDKGIPWDLPTDAKWFVDQTREGVILMGYGTYKEFKRPMHGRTNYVATHSAEQLLPGFVAVHDLPKFFEEHKNETVNNIGGAGLFASTMEYADELVVTKIEADFHCTKFLPPYEEDFTCVSTNDPITENGVTFRFTIWKRKS